MLIIPAIDLKDGCVVRFVRGRGKKKVYSRDPLAVARYWVKEGAKSLHVVDLDGAFSGKQKNIGLVEKIARNISIPVEFGGGIRSPEAIKKAFKIGVWRVVLGTKAVEDADFLKNALRQFKGRIIVSIDAKGSAVLTKGWKSSNKKTDLVSFASFLKKSGLREIIYTNTQKDGTLTGPDTKGVKSLLKKTGLNIIASGGISGLKDITQLKKLEKLGLTGVIIGKALYEDKFTLREAIKIS